LVGQYIHSLQTSSLANNPSATKPNFGQASMPLPESISIFHP
jgi:hypothetical protein